MKKARSSSESSSHGIIISGEASESEDDDIDVKFSEESGFTCLDQNYIAKNSKPSLGLSRKKSPKRKDLLQQKLYETNIALHKRLTSDFEDPVIESSKKVSKLNPRIYSAHNHTKLSTTVLRRATENVEGVLKKLSSLDYSHLPTKRPLTN